MHDYSMPSILNFEDKGEIKALTFSAATERHP